MSGKRQAKKQEKFEFNKCSVREGDFGPYLRLASDNASCIIGITDGKLGDLEDYLSRKAIYNENLGTEFNQTNTFSLFTTFEEPDVFEIEEGGKTYKNYILVDGLIESLDWE